MHQFVHSFPSFRSFASRFASCSIPGLMRAGRQKTPTDSRASPCGIDAALEQSLRFAFRNPGPSRTILWNDYLTTLGFLWFLADPKSLHENLCICHILSQSEVGPGNIAYIARLTVNGITVSSRRACQRLAMKR